MYGCSAYYIDLCSSQMCLSLRVVIFINEGLPSGLQKVFCFAILDILPYLVDAGNVAIWPDPLGYRLHGHAHPLPILQAIPSSLLLDLSLDF